MDETRRSFLIGLGLAPLTGGVLGTAGEALAEVPKEPTSERRLLKLDPQGLDAAVARLMKKAKGLEKSPDSLIKKGASLAADLLGEAGEKEKSEARKLYLIGLAAYELRENALAERLFEASFRKEKSAETAGRLAIVHFLSADYGPAADWIGQALKLEPKGSLTQPVLGTKNSFHAIAALVAFASGDAKGAAEKAKLASAEADDRVLSTQVIALTALVAGDTKGALSQLEEGQRKTTARGAGELRLLGERVKAFEALAVQNKVAISLADIMEHVAP